VSRQPVITQEFLKSVLHYNRRTGIFTWRERSDVRPQWNGRYAGKQAGYEWSPANSDLRYIMIRLLDWPFAAHRLAVLYVTGILPPGVDHKDENGLNNRWTNLRRASKSQNGFNRGKNKNNTSGFKGVSRTKNGRWKAQIMKRGKLHWLGSHPTPETAHEAYVAAATRLHGRFARAA